MKKLKSDKMFGGGSNLLTKKQKIITIVLFILLITLVVTGTYAIWTYNFTGNKNVIETGSVSIEFLESDTGVISLTNALPTTDEDGKKGKAFDFVVTTKSSRDINIKYTLTIEKLTASSGYTSLNNEDVKMYLTDNQDNEIISPSLASNIGENLYSKVNVHNNSKTEIKDKYKLRAWLDYDYDVSNVTANSKLEYKFKIGVKADEYKSLDKSGANAPVLSSNMIPVYFSESDSTWRKADSTNSIEEYKWYDYNNKMWANSVTVTQTNRSTYLNAEPGTTIPMSDILTMQVWIPRYKYEIFNYNENGTTYKEAQQINVTFEQSTASTGDIKCTDNIQGTSDGTINGTLPTSSEKCILKKTNEECTDATCNTKTYTHPAFTFGGKDVEGIWVGKFELTGTISNITTKPDVQSLRTQTVGSFATNIMNMKNTNNVYGFNTSDDTHMMKNTEWGAVAYLTQSKYGMCTSGTCKEINFNNSSGYYTGRSGGNAGGSTGINTVYPDQNSTAQYNIYGFYTYDGYLLNYDTNTKSNTRDLSKIASTTGNIYGIYDMSGGAYEYMMANIISFDGKIMMSGASTTYNSGYTGIVYDFESVYNSYAGTYNYPNSKYYDKYSFNTTRTDRRVTKLGDAVKEVGVSMSRNWYEDYGYVVNSTNPWVMRGGNYRGGVTAGLFYSDDNGGNAAGGISARLVLLPNVNS